MSDKTDKKGANKANWDDFVKSIQFTEEKKDSKAKSDPQKEVSKDA